jgi:hypothetical protein
MKTVAALLASAIAAFGVNGTTTAPTIVIPCVTIERTLSSGMSGADVMKLQQFLRVKQSGYFGPLTQKSLTTWQISAHIITSPKSPGAGTTGPKTRAALRCTSAPNPPAPVQIHSITPTSTSVSAPVIATTTAAPISPPVPIVTGGGGSVSATAQCKPFTVPQPPASECAVGQWILVDDEAGCPVEWDCQDPNVSQ